MLLAPGNERNEGIKLSPETRIIHNRIVTHHMGVKRKEETYIGGMHKSHDATELLGASWELMKSIYCFILYPCRQRGFSSRAAY